MTRHLWVDAYGPYGFKVPVFERTPGGALYARLPNANYRGPGSGPRYQEKPLGHTGSRTREGVDARPRRTEGCVEAHAERTAGGQVKIGPELRQELWKRNAKSNRGGGIRTHDLLVPNPAVASPFRASCALLSTNPHTLHARARSLARPTRQTCPTICPVRPAQISAREI